MVQGDQNVDDWFSCEARNGGAPDVLNVDKALTEDPRKHRCFHLENSIPGYGYSGKPTETGWGPERIARTWVELMRRLGYTKFVAQGGDWGAVVVDMMGLQAPPELLAIHTNMAGIFPADIDAAAFSGQSAPSGLSDDEKVAYERVQFVYQKGIAYGFQMGLRPQTLYGIADSPVGLAGYFLDHDARS